MKLLIVLTLTLLCSLFAHAATLAFSLKDVKLISGAQKLTKMDVETEATTKDRFYYGKAKNVGGIDYLAYTLEYTGDLAPVPKRNDELVTQADFSRSTPVFSISNDFSMILGSSITCRSPGAIIFGDVVKFPTIPVNEATKTLPTTFPAGQVLQIEILMRKDLFCTWELTGLSGAYGSNKILDAAKMKIQATTFNEFRIAILPFVPSSSGAPTAGRASTRPNFSTLEREVVWDVLFSHPMQKDNNADLHSFLKYSSNYACCTNADCTNTGVNADCRSQSPISMQNGKNINFRWRYIQRFSPNANNPIVGTGRTLEIVVANSVTVSTINLDNGMALSPRNGPGGGNLAISLNTAKYEINLTPLELVANGIKIAPGRAGATDPLSSFTVEFTKPPAYFRYGREFVIIPSTASLRSEFLTRYTVTSTPSDDKKTWTITVTPPIYSPGNYNVGVVTACTGECGKSQYTVPVDRLVPTPLKLTGLGGQLVLNNLGLPAGTVVNGQTFLKSANCPKPLFACTDKCVFPTESNCANCVNLCPAAQVCYLSGTSGAGTRFLDAGDATCGATQIIITVDGNPVSALLRQDTQPASDPENNNVRTFPFKCLDGQNPSTCAMTRNLRELWEKAPALLSNQIYLVNRRSQFRFVNVNGLRFRLYSLMCADKASNINNDPALAKERAMFVRAPTIQADDISFKAVAVGTNDVYDIEFWGIQPSRCVEKVYAPVIISLEWNKKRSMEGVEKVLVDDARVVAYRDQIQIRAVDVDTYKSQLIMDRTPPTVTSPKCSADGIRVTCGFVLSEPGTVVVVVLPHDAPVPVLPKVLAGQDANGHLSPFVRIRCPTAGVRCRGEVAGLIGSTDYRAYYIAYDARNEPNVQESVSSVVFTTSSLANTPNAVAINTDFAEIVSIK
jgi:hypothetical protein